jgi:putative addiction module component (TIGR02574 family)
MKAGAPTCQTCVKPVRSNAHGGRRSDSRRFVRDGVGKTDLSEVLALVRYTGYTSDMSTQTQELLSVALTLSEIERANLAGSLLRSLDPSPDPLADKAWAAEIERRVQAIDRGEVSLTPWDEVMATMRQSRNG